MPVMMPRDSYGKMRRGGSKAARTQHQHPVDERGRVHSVPELSAKADKRVAGKISVVLKTGKEKRRWGTRRANRPRLRGLADNLAGGKRGIGTSTADLQNAADRRGKAAGRSSQEAIMELFVGCCLNGQDKYLRRRSRWQNHQGMQSGDGSVGYPWRAENLCRPSPACRYGSSGIFTLARQKSHENGVARNLRRGRSYAESASAQRNKTDRNDARGIAHMMRFGWFREVHVKDDDTQRLRVLLSGRRLLKRKLVDIENELRGSLKAFRNQDRRGKSRRFRDPRNGACRGR
jgi:Transposase